MKRILMVALCLMLLICPVLAGAEGAPIAKEDIDQIVQTGYPTMGDYINAFKPIEFSWYFDGKATGNTIFTVGVEGGSITLSVTDATKYQDDEQGMVGAKELTGDVLGKPAELVGAYWDTSALTLVSLPRGLKLGDSKEKLMETIGELEITGMEFGEYEEDYDEAASCMIKVNEFEEYGFDFYIKEGILSKVQLWYAAAE